MILLLIQVAAQDQAGFDPDPALLPHGGAVRVQDFKTIWEGNPDPWGLLCGLRSPIWRGIGAQDPHPVLFLRGSGPKLFQACGGALPTSRALY